MPVVGGVGRSLGQSGPVRASLPLARAHSLRAEGSLMAARRMFTWAMWQPWLQRLLMLVFFVTAFHPRAWDAERMLVAAQKQGSRALAGAKALQAVMHGAQDLDDDGKLAAITQFFNRRILSREDIDVWGQVDYWASPLEMLDKGAGDCEDFAIAKYFSLVALGMPIQKLRLVYVRAQIGGPGGAVQAHMVLAYYATPNAEPMILDNLISDVRPASSRSTILVAKKLPIESVSASPGEPATRPRQVDADARDGEVQPLARTSRHSRRGPRTRSHGLAHCALASASTGQTALIPCHSTRL